MSAQTVAEALAETRLLAIIRSSTPDHVVAAVRVLVDVGVRVLEVSLNTPSALSVVSELRRLLDSDVQVGVGTVINREAAASAIASGAGFLVTPCLVPDVLELGQQEHVPVLSGALSPTEIVQARDLGASAVKVFPASLGGPGYVRALREPFPEIPLVPTGGVGLGDVADYLSAGALALGIGGALTGDAVDGGDCDALRLRAASLIADIQSTVGQR